MADTIRTIQELNNLLSDNNVGAITEQELRDVLVSMNVHTEIGMTGYSGGINTNWNKLPLNIAGVFERGVNANIMENQIDNVPVDMKAEVYAEVHIKTNPPVSQDFSFAVFVNDTIVPATRRDFNERGHMTWSIGVQLSQGDVVDLRARAESVTTITLGLCVLRLKRIGVE